MAKRMLALFLAASVAGCGLMMTRGPDAGRAAEERPVCTESMDAPKRDAYGAGGGFFAILVGLLFLKADDNADVGVPLLVGGAVVMVASYASGGIGYYRVKRCRKAIGDFQRRRLAPQAHGG